MTFSRVKLKHMFFISMVIDIQFGVSSCSCEFNNLYVLFLNFYRNKNKDIYEHDRTIRIKRFMLRRTNHSDRVNVYTFT